MFIDMELQQGSSDTAGPDNGDLGQVLLFLFILAGLANNMDSVPIFEATCKEGGPYNGIVKTSHSLYPKKELEDVIKTSPGGTHL
eukprot:9980773-Ditylum_brightwellii.AAC.1